MTRSIAITEGLERRTIVAGGVERTYWHVGGASPHAPALALQGLGMTAPHLDQWTGLATRGPAAGFATVLPEGIAEMWDDTGRGRVDGVDDDSFARALVTELTNGAATRRPLFLAGLSNGGLFAERLARAGIVTPRDLVLVASTTRRATRETTPRPTVASAMLCFAGTADRSVPYAGGRASGGFAWLARRRASQRLLDPTGREVVGAETLAEDRAARNGSQTGPAREAVSGTDLPVQRMTWHAPGAPPVVLYRIEAGAHGWPGGPQYLPARFIGRIPRRLDATGILLSFDRELLETAADPAA